MTTEQRIEAVKEIVASLPPIAENITEAKILNCIVQLLMICKNQQAEIDALMAVEEDRLDKLNNHE